MKNCLKNLIHTHLFGTCSLLILLLTSCSNSAKAPPPERKLYVKTAEATQADVPVYVEAIGNVFPNLTVAIKPQVEGKLLAVHVKEGQDVTKGELLYSIDPSIYQAELDRAKGNLHKAKAALRLSEDRVKRYSGLVKNDYVSQLSFDEFKTEVMSNEAEVQVNRANLALAKINLGYCSIRSPIEGRISQYLVDVGNIVKADSNTILTTVKQISPALINFAISQHHFATVKQAFTERPLTFEAILPDNPTKAYPGEVFFVDNAVDLRTGTLLMKGRTPNAEKELWPGAFVRVRLLLEVKNQAIVVPLSAIQYGQQGTFVYVVKPDQTVALQVVETGVTQENRIVVSQGLAPNDIVVIDGQINLRPGSKVTIQNDAPATANPAEKE